jgi:hypothetical protein
MIAIAVVLLGFVLFLALTIRFGLFLARGEVEEERRLGGPPRTLREAHSLHARLVRSIIEGPEDER